MTAQTQGFDRLRRDSLILITVFLLAFLSLLVIEQGRTIEAQRTLIRQLFTDSLELNAMKAREVQQQQRR